MTYRNILVEGCDGTGKTQFISDLYDAIMKNDPSHRVIMFHNGPMETPEIAYETYRSQLKKAKEQDATCIIDRAHLSELVYGLIHHGRFTKYRDFGEMDSDFIDDASLLIYCRVPFEVVRRTWHSRRHHEMVKEVNKLENVYDFYEYAIYDITGMDRLMYDYTLNDTALIPEIVRMVCEPD